MHEAWEISKCFDCFYFVFQEKFDNSVVITSTPKKLMEASESASLNEAHNSAKSVGAITCRLGWSHLSKSCEPVIYYFS